MQPVQDIQIGTRLSRTQFQYTLIDTDPPELAHWAPRLLAKLRDLPELRDVATDQQDEGFRTFIRVDRDAAMRLGVTMQAIQDMLYDASASGRSPPSSARPTSIAWCWRPIRPGRPIPTRCCAAARAGQRRRAGAADRHRHASSAPPRRW